MHSLADCDAHPYGNYVDKRHREHGSTLHCEGTAAGKGEKGYILKHLVVLSTVTLDTLIQHVHVRCVLEECRSQYNGTLLLMQMTQYPYSSE